MAEEQGIDLNKVHGTGPGGRIVKQDIEAYMGHESGATVQMKVTEQPQSGAESHAAPQPAAPLVSRKEPFSRMRATIAKRMARVAEVRILQLED